MANTRQAEPEFLSIIAELNNLGVEYLVRVQRRNFFDKAVGRHANSKGAQQLIGLTMEAVEKMNVPQKWLPFQKSVKEICDIQNENKSGSNLKWENPNLYEYFELHLKLLSYLEKMIEDAKEGSLFLPKIKDILVKFYNGKEIWTSNKLLSSFGYQKTIKQLLLSLVDKYFYQTYSLTQTEMARRINIHIGFAKGFIQACNEFEKPVAVQTAVGSSQHTLINQLSSSSEPDVSDVLAHQGSPRF